MGGKKTAASVTRDLQTDALNQGVLATVEPIITPNQEFLKLARDTETSLFGNLLPELTKPQQNLAGDDTARNLLRNLGIPEAKIQEIYANHGAPLEDVKNQLNTLNKTKSSQASKTYENFQTVMAICGVLNTIARATGSAELAQGAAMLGVFAQIGLGIAMIAINPVLGIVSIIGALFSLFEVFSKPGPNPHQLILNQIGKLSDQISHMHKDMIELFAQNFKMQKMLLNVMMQGFRNLSELVSNQTGCLGATMEASLDRIETMQRDLLKQTAIGQQQIFIKNFIHLQAQIEEYIAGNIQGENNQHLAKGFASDISAWSTRHTCNSLLNGAGWRGIESAGKIAEVLNSILDPNPQDSANGVLGFFEPSLPNPYFWLATVNVYSKLTQHCWNMDFDKVQKEKMREKGEAVKKYCYDLAHEDNRWDDALKNYYQALEAVKKNVDVFGAHRSKIWLQELNKAYTSVEQKQPEIKIAFNLLEDTNAVTLIDCFNPTVRHLITPQLILNDNVVKVLDPNNADAVLITKPIGQLKNLDAVNINRKLNVSKELLCAEFMGIAKISIKQNASITGLECKGSPMGKNGNSIALNIDLAENKKHPEWALTFNTSVKFSGEATALEMLKSVFKKNWASMSKIIKFWNNDEESIGVAEGKFNDFLLKHTDMIADEINRNSADFKSETIADLKTQANASINREIIRLKNDIAMRLCNDVNDDVPGQVLHENFSNALVYLNYCARKLQHMLYLSGKDVNTTEGKAALEKILTAEQLVNLLKTSQTTMTKPEWLTCLNTKLDIPSRLTGQNIINLKAGAMNGSHPAKIAEQGIFLLNLNEAVIESTRLKFPMFRHYVSLSKYETLESKRYNEQALRMIYESIDAIRREKYETSRFRIKKSNPVNAQEYRDYFLNFKQWATHTATETNFIGKASDAHDIFNERNLWSATTRLTMQGGWERNIATLHQLALLADNEPSNQKQDGLLNYVMWRDGLNKIVKMITHPRFADKSVGLLDVESGVPEADKSIINKSHVVHLQDVIIKGRSLSKTLECIADSKVIEMIQQQYTSKLNELVMLVKREKNKQQADDNTLFSQFFEGHHAGNSIKLLDDLDGYRALLVAYCQMILGYFPWEESMAALKNKDELMTILKSKSQQGKGIVEKLETLASNSKIAIDEILDLFKQIRELIKYRENLLALATGSKTKSLFSIEGSTLVINAKELEFGFDDLKANLLDAFLSQTQGVEGIRFIGEDFTQPKNLQCALKFITRHPEIHTLGLCKSGLTGAVIEECLPEFSEIKQIHSLALNDNPLITTNDAFCGPLDTARLCDLIRSLPELNNLDVKGVELDDSTKRTLTIFFEINPEIIINFEEIPTLSDGNIKVNDPIKLDHLLCVGPKSLNHELKTLEELTTDLNQKITNSKIPDNGNTLSPRMGQAQARLFSNSTDTLLTETVSSPEATHFVGKPQ